MVAADPKQEAAVPSPPPSVAQPCKFWLTNGRCDRGAHCPFAHSTDCEQLRRQRKEWITARRGRAEGLNSPLDAAAAEGTGNPAVTTSNHSGATGHKNSLDSFKPQIRLGRQEDAQIICARFVQTDASDDFIQEATVKSWLSDSSVGVLLAEQMLEMSSQLVGMVMVRIEAAGAYIGGLRVASDARRQGVGSLLVIDGYDWAVRKMDAQTVRMAVRRDNHAMRYLVRNLPEMQNLSVFAADGSGQELLSIESALRCESRRSQKRSVETVENDKLIGADSIQ